MNWEIKVETARSGSPPGPPPELRGRSAFLPRSRVSWWGDRGRGDRPMVAAYAVATKKMVTKTLEMTTAMLVGFQLGGRYLQERSALAIISVLSFPVRTRSHKSPPPIAFWPSGRFALPLRLSFAAQPQFSPCLHSLRHFIRRLLTSMGTQSPTPVPLSKGPC
jgi:hypothetical protein